MRGVFLLARRYIAFHRWKTVTVVACVALTIYLPIAVQLLIGYFNQQLTARAEATPLVVGAKGSRFDLTLHAMYFHAKAAEEITVRDWHVAAEHTVDGVKLADTIPLFVQYKVRKTFPIVGTTLEYFAFRGLNIARGQQLIRLGDCVIGWQVAHRMGIGPGDRVLSDPTNLWDLAGSYPLAMRVVGVLERSYSPDDEAVFVDVKTAWIIDGIGHGHKDLAETKDDSVIIERENGKVVANEKLVQFTEITDDNVDTFHFHGDEEDFPLTAVLAIPKDDRSRTIMIGRYLAPDSETQALLPVDVIEDLMSMVFQIQRLFNVGALLLGIVTLLLLALVVRLSLQLRQREMETMFKLGCSRFTILWIQTVELAIVLGISLVLAAAMSAATYALAPSLLRDWVVG